MAYAEFIYLKDFKRIGIVIVMDDGELVGSAAITPDVLKSEVEKLRDADCARAKKAAKSKANQWARPLRGCDLCRWSGAGGEPCEKMRRVTPEDKFLESVAHPTPKILAEREESKKMIGELQKIERAANKMMRVKA